MQTPLPPGGDDGRPRGLATDAPEPTNTKGDDPATAWPGDANRLACNSRGYPVRGSAGLVQRHVDAVGLPQDRGEQR